MNQLLIEQLGQATGNAYSSQFTLAKHKLGTEIYDHIRGVEPNLSDHGERHIDNVLENAYMLIGGELKASGLSAIEIYCLGTAILFHDVGNLFGRDNHREKISEVFDWIRGSNAAVRSEKTIITRAAWAHTGSSYDGTKDTLKDLSTSEQLERRQVRLREIAAILRFADELAEGPQRTSEFMRVQHKYTPDSLPFHDYADMTHIHIDRGNRRIALKYEIALPDEGTQRQRESVIKRQLRFVYQRIEKLDQERRYASFYSDLLRPFVATEVTFNFHYGSRVLDPFLKPLQLTDKVVPGDPTRSVPTIDSTYAIETVVGQIRELCK